MWAQSLLSLKAWSSHELPINCELTAELLGFTHHHTVRSVNVVFVNYKGQRTTLKAEVGKTLLHAAMDNAWPFIDGMFAK